MKRTLMILSAVVCILSMSGCSDDTVKTTSVRKENSIAETSLTEIDNEAATDASVEESSEIETQKDEENSEATEAEEQSEDQLSYSNESGEITDVAVELHKKSCDMMWNYIFNCPYELDQEDVTDNGAFRVIGVDSIEQIKNEYSAVFVDTEDIDEKYFEQNGNVYCIDGGRGANIYYTGTELIKVSADDNEALFTAVSHYADPETKEPMDSRSYDFKMINSDGVWKTSEFTLPY